MHTEKMIYIPKIKRILEIRRKQHLYKKSTGADKQQKYECGERKKKLFHFFYSSKEDVKWRCGEKL